MKDEKLEVPTDIASALELAKKLAQEACDDAFAVFGERPHWVQRGNSLFIVWPDGEETNEIEVGHLQ
jgi:hypothetical protein